ncbi:hypothetical protein E4Z66_06415 [Aliishimia ponticola]|uniref:Uncharacterized protein n=1 Tax=Aliishimia ponticola TaxID=2499833 RepID=A0A4S4NEP2_9RHOB|nr:hypothetical protein [Aliishimia ponticola]THH36581.1 hypothetical protein E4Z66_06415 [Aliishimia ponticola]
MLRVAAFFAFILLCAFPHSVFAGPQSLFAGTSLGTSRKALLPRASGSDAAIVISTRASAPAEGPSSLFSGREAGSLLAPVLPRSAVQAPLPPTSFAPYAGGRVAQLRTLIAKAEAGRKGYDAVQYGARIKPRKAPTQMTIREIYAWIDATPGQPHAIGRYQFIPKTLRRLVQQLGVPETAVFSPQVQDLLGDRLLEDAGLSKFLRGEMSQTSFMNNLAKIWAGLPNSSGKSHYHGYAGNHATMTWGRFKSEMTRIFATG